MNCLIQAKVDRLTLWNVSVDGELYDVHDNRIKADTMLMTCYFNIGVDAEIGASKFINTIFFLTNYYLLDFERTRT